MAQAEIGKLNVRIAASAGELERELDRADAGLKNFAKNAEHNLSGGGFLGNIQGGIGDVVGKIKEGLSGGGLLGGAGATTGVLAAGFHKLVEASAELGEHHLQTARQAELFGIKTEALTGLTIAAKDKADEMQMALFHLQRELGGAASGSEESQKKFQKLGISWEKLVDLPLDRAFGRVNDAIAAQSTQAERGRAAFEIYGRQGQQTLRLIAEGSEGIEKGIDKAFTKGLEPSKAFMDAFKEYKGASAELDRSLLAVKNRFYEIFGTPALQIAASWKDQLAKLADEVTKFADAFTGTDRNEEKQRKAAEDARQEAENRAARLRDQGIKAQAAAQELAQKDTTELEKKLRVLTIGNDAAREFEIRTKAGAEASATLNAELEKRAKLSQQIADKMAATDLEKQGGTALSKAADEIDRISGLFARGAINGVLFDKSIGRVAQTLLDLDKTTSQAGVPALVRGTQAERTLMLQFDRAAQEQQKDPIEKLKAIIAQELESDRRREAIQQKIVDAIKQGKLSIAKF